MVVTRSKTNKVKALNNSLRLNNIILVGAATVGLLLSLYALYVELKHAQNPGYRALCDISESMSCSHVFMSRYGKGFGLLPEKSILSLPNPIYGIVFYIVFIILVAISPLTNQQNVGLIILASSVASVLMSAYLGYILYAVLKDLCVVCVSTYVANFVLCIGAIHRIIVIRDSSNSGPAAVAASPRSKKNK